MDLRTFPRLLAVVLAGVVAVTLTACGSSASAPNISGGSQLDAVIPAKVAQLAFTNQDGATVHLADFKGKNIVIQDGMTLCQEQCPISTSTFVSMARQYAASAKSPQDTVFLSITVDPERDNTAQIAAYRKLFAPGAGELPQWQMLTGSKADIAALWKYFHVWYAKVASDDVVHNWRTGQRLTFDVQHSDEVFFVDRSLTQRYVLEGMPSLGGKIPATIEHFMSEEGMENMKMSNWTVANGISALNWTRSH